MGYWSYYLAWIALTYALHRPWLMVGALVFFVLRPFIPDPWILLKTFGRMRALESQIAANPANITARRDLATLWLERLRPGRALELLDEALKRAPDDAELLYLTGLARHRAGDPEGALDPLVKAVDIDPRIRFGEPYLVAAEALSRLKRYEEAEDALERYIESNSSSIQGYVLLASARSERGDREGARKAIAEALSTWSQMPPYKRRSELGWWMRAQLYRVWI
jgi:predicted Zn-dependent protease